MNAVRQKLRPKHQVLVLKCYPRFQKGVQDVKPNSSELSYLLYYATTRRSKLQKVGAFLEKKATSDVGRKKLGNIQVTLQILTALIEKSPRDLPLYVRSVLAIIETVLQSNDISMVEETIPTFEMFCKHQDAASLTADQERTNQYQNIVKTYAGFASKSPTEDTKTPLSTPVLIQWRSVGLRAIKSVVSSESLGLDGGKVLTIVMPVVLQNLYTMDEDSIPFLQQRVQASEMSEKEQARRRRMSIATVTTVDTIEANPATAAGSTADADKVAEDEVRILAVRCLKQIFSVGSNRGQVRIATALTLRFIASKNPPRKPSISSLRSLDAGNWATSLMEMVTRWAPVQDRFIILLTAMETLVRSPIMEENLEKQLTLTTMIDWLLSSTINLIGLSVMDVLLGLVQHILILLQLGGRDSKLLPHLQQADAIDLFHDAKQTFDNIVPSMSDGRNGTQFDPVNPSPVRQELLTSLTKCIGSLATHIYYADQISDMIAAILTRLKPSQNSEVSTAAIAIENPAATANVIANSGNLQEDPNTDSFFSFATARVAALNAVKDILLVANLRKSMTGSAAESRNRVGVQVWESTQWLLRDEDRRVRHAYVDALLTWLKLETSKNDLKATMERKLSKVSKRNVSNNTEESTLTRRAVSSASHREKTAKTPKSTFLQLLHLAIYDNAIDYPNVESDILISHLLLTNLTEKLGVNAAQHGLPMIFRLQEDLTSDECISTADGMINVGSLVIGYFWALSEKFDFETSAIGSQIHQEVSRRKKQQLWFEKIRVPPIALDHIQPASTPTVSQNEPQSISPASLKAYQTRDLLVEEIVNAYQASLASPAASPPSSPGRIFSIPALSYGYGYTPTQKPVAGEELPEAVKNQMLSEWSKEACIAAVERESAKTASLTGSKTGTTGRNYLAVNGNANGNESPGGSHSPGAAHHKHNDHNRPASAAYGLVGGLGGLQKIRRSSSQQGSPIPLSSSSRDSTVRVNELKRVLSTNARHASPLRSRPDYARSSSSSESMVSADFSTSDIGIGTTPFAPVGRDEHTRPRSSRDSQGFGHEDSQSPQAGPTNAGPPSESRERPTMARRSEDIPPVPPLPVTLAIPGRFPSTSDLELSTTASGEHDAFQDASSQPEQSAPQSRPEHDSESQRPPTTSHSQLHPESILSSDGARAGRSLKRKKSGRPGSRWAEKASLNSWVAEGGERVDLGALLGRISVEDDGRIADGEAKGRAVLKPPY